MSATALDQVERLAMQLSPSEQLRLMEDLARLLQRSHLSRPPRDLYGDWKSKLPADVDIDAILRQVRASWQNEANEP